MLTKIVHRLFLGGRSARRSFYRQLALAWLLKLLSRHLGRVELVVGRLFGEVNEGSNIHRRRFPVDGAIVKSEMKRYR